ncbi:FG-GAP repeat protein [Arhodomonas aquaeolei]|uniref:FG-GAP repeat protein n=1 Tax=Arhodomonas aquaeolei TaxID=2369 RepID=UPI00216A6303|nr:FG-GAP repeat protein [Arhodomonas aquaeolei]MCS4503369.1 FG-GAP repeat protein [Arhodomonas aquaeolei]
MPFKDRCIPASPLCRVLFAALITVSFGAGAASPVTFVARQAVDGDVFGTTVAIDDGRVAVGASSTDLERDDVGAVYLFDRTGGGIAPAAMLQASDGELADGFGASVAVSGDTVLVGAPGVVLSELNEGAAYLFERKGGAWTPVAKLRRDTVGKNDMAGVAVALDGGVAAIGAPGADVVGEDSGVVLVYERGEGGWTKTASLTPKSAGERFGSAVAVDGDRILVGASGDVPAKETTGSAYVFERRDSGWEQAARLTPSDGGGGDGFGDAVALAGDRALVGARFADLDGSDEGAAYVFGRTGEGWSEIAKLTAPEPADRDQFGHAVALAGDIAVVGAPRVDEPGRDSGAVWTFAPGDDGWRLSTRLSPSAPDTYDEFGSAVAAGQGAVVVGAPQDIPADADGEVVTGTATLFPAVH